MTPQSPTTPDTVVVPVEDLLFFRLKDLITEQSEGEWTDAMVIRDAHHFANNLRPLLAARPAATPGGEREAVRRAIIETAKIGMVPISPDHVRSGVTNVDEITDAILAALSHPAPVAAPQPAAARGGEDVDWQSVAMWMGFAASAIKSGEAWSAQCQQHYDEALAAFSRLNDALSAKGGS